VQTTVLSSEQVLLADGQFHAARIEVAEDRILSISPLGPNDVVTTELMLAPGFVDLQVNGIDDVDVWSTALAEDVGAWDRINNLLLDQGVTSWCPTLVTAPLDWYPKAIEFLRGQSHNVMRPHVIGVHLEGPFLGNAIGAHREQYVCVPDGAWIQENLDGVALMTLGAEVSGATELCNLLRSRGCRISIGHSLPTREEFENCVSAGATLVTHLFNAMSGVHHREPGLATWALTNDNVFASLIADGIHVSADVIELSFSAKPHKMVLVTDAVAWRAGSAGKIRISLHDGAPRLENGTLAGSAVMMPEAIKVCVEQAHVALAQALQAASSNPANVMGLSDRGVLQTGYMADIVGLTNDLSVGAVWVSGQRAR
jgi:N-acetylglucosamine-6-phosphate deacetylase